MKYVRTTTQLADCLDMTRQALYKGWMGKDGFPVKSSKGWCVDMVAEFIRGWKDKERNQSGMQNTLKHKKLEREIDILDVKLAEMKGDLIDRQILKDEIATVCGVLLDGLNQFEQKAKLTRKPELVDIAEKVSDEVKRYLRGRIDAE